MYIRVLNRVVIPFGGNNNNNNNNNNVFSEDIYMQFEIDKFTMIMMQRSKLKESNGITLLT